MCQKRNLCTLLVGIQISSSTVENNMGIPQKNKNGGTTGPINLTAGHICPGNDNQHVQGCLHSHIHCTIITAAKIWNLSSTNGKYMNEENAVHPQRKTNDDDWKRLMLCHFQQHGWIWRHSSKLEEEGTGEGHILHDPIYSCLGSVGIWIHRSKE